MLAVSGQVAGVPLLTSEAPVPTTNSLPPFLCAPEPQNKRSTSEREGGQGLCAVEVQGSQKHPFLQGCACRGAQALRQPAPLNRPSARAAVDGFCPGPNPLHELPRSDQAVT